MGQHPTSFIPYQGHQIIPGYAVTDEFDDDNLGLSKIGNKYQDYLSGLVSGNAIPNQHAIGKALGNLQGYVQQERAAEIAFLNEMGELLGIQLDDTTTTWRLLIESFNKIFGTADVLKRNVTQLKSLYAQTSNKKSEDVTRHLRDTYLPQAIQSFMPIKSIRQITNKLMYQIMQKAVELMFSAKDVTDTDTKQEIQCYQEIWNALSQLSSSNALYRSLADQFNLKEYLINNLNTIKNTDKYTNYPDIKAVEQNSAGKVLETIEAAALSQLAQTKQIGIKSGDVTLLIDFMATGDTKQKADTFGMVMEQGTINAKNIMTGGKATKNNSYRLRSLERMEELLKQIGDKKAQLIFVSDKNYQIGNNTYHEQHGGFAAESPTLSTLINYGPKFHIPNITNMVEYLASAGPGMIVEDTDVCLEVIRISIGNFLFDDLQITGPSDSGANRVHLLNLGNTYMPASVFLEATLQGLEGVGNFNKDEMVQVDFEPSTTTAGSATTSNWDAFKTERLKSHINIHFLSGYTHFMSTIFK